MAKVNARPPGVELYFENLPPAKQLYGEILGLRVTDETAGHHVQFYGGSMLLCLKQRGLKNTHHSSRP